MNRDEYAIGLLAFCGWEVSYEKRLGIVSWGVSEDSNAAWNILDSTEPAAGATPYNTIRLPDGEVIHVWNYPNEQVAFEAVHATLMNGHYPNVVRVLSDPAGGSALDLAAAVGNSPWGTGNFSPTVERVKADPAPYFSHIVAGSGNSPTPPSPSPGPGPVPTPPTEDDDMAPFVTTFNDEQWVIWNNGTKTHVATPEDGTLLTKPLAEGGAGLPYVPGLSPQFVASLPGG